MSGSADLGFDVTSAADNRLALTGLFHVADGQLVPVSEPWVLFNAAPQAEVVLTVEADRTYTRDEYTRLIGAIASITEVAPVDLTPGDVTFLTAEFAAVDGEVDRHRIELLVEAERLSNTAREQDLDVPAPAFYGLGNTGPQVCRCCSRRWRSRLSTNCGTGCGRPSPTASCPTRSASGSTPSSGRSAGWRRRRCCAIPRSADSLR